MTTVDKKYVLPIPTGTDKLGEYSFYAWSNGDYGWVQTFSYYTHSQTLTEDKLHVTKAQIAAAPDWVRILKPVEVKEDD
ncbi:hypothetical protein [Lacticaseibacillus brantae]|uniref:hypothetical protein n=1 Tax=Lacticaseibacillus brantae TaxID=943673 RepID=UPI00070B800E|nr:hypothetical protein [Lacticaseibacillus brantae]